MHWGLQGSQEAEGWLSGAVGVRSRGIQSQNSRMKGALPSRLELAPELEWCPLWASSWGGWDSRGVREEWEGDLTRPQQSVIPQPQHRVQGAQHGLCGALKGPSW